MPIPDDLSRFRPPADVSWADALKHLRWAVSRSDHERMEADHPFLGPFSHAQWVRFRCRHAELHFSFMHAAP